MFDALNKIIENEVRETNLDFYSVIIGTKPSAGARSPKLWNKVYDFEGKKIRMVPLDVKDGNLEKLFNHLKEDRNCLGGAVAVPYKERVFNLIEDNLKNEIKDIGAVNCFYRPPSQPLINTFTGTNTDGEAALEPIGEHLTKRKNLSICLLGLGGAGKAILAFLLRDFGNKHKIKVFNRSTVNIKDVKKLGSNAYFLDDLAAHIPQFDILINATSVGHIENINATPVSMETLKKAKKTLVIYDIIYDPIKTRLLETGEKLGLRTINGLRMNLIQAVLAFSYTNRTSLSIEEIYNAMR